MKKYIVPYGVKMLQIKVISLLMFLLLIYIWTLNVLLWKWFSKTNPYMEVILQNFKH